jgi:hypothetical protein
MLSDFLAKNIKSQAKFVTYGYGQVEPNHLSAQRTGQIYAQLPANKNIDVLENGQFVKYDYANEEVNFTGAGEWMLVFNEIKLYREHQMDCEFAMKKGDYIARVYSPVAADTNFDAQSRYYGGKIPTKFDEETGKAIEFADIEKVTAPADMYELHYNENPFHIESQTAPKLMDGKVMVPRVFKTNVGDIMTTNTINAEPDSLAVGATLKVGADGLLVAGEDDKMTWQVVKVYTLPDHQPAVKIMRIA